MRTPWMWAGLALVSLAGCDSITPLSADLGQGGQQPTLEATLGVVPTVGQSITFAGTEARPLPTEWNSARTIKMAIAGTQLSLAAAGDTYVATLPAQAGTLIARSAVETPVLFTLNGENSMVAKVVFK